MSLRKKMQQVLQSKTYVREKELHDNNCESGYIYYINKFFPQNSSYVECQFCKKVRIAREKKRIKMQEKMAKEGQLSQSNETSENL